MPRKTNFSRKEMSMRNLPIRMESYPMNNLAQLEIAKASLPFYGGTTPVTQSPPADAGKTQEEGQSAGQPGNDTPPPTAGGDSGQMTPEQVADLLKQVSQLTTTNKQLLTENNTFKSQQQQKERETMGREQALEQDLANATEMIQKLDNALKNQAVLNAINGFQDIQFHDPKFVMHELSQDIYESMEVDLDSGTVTVNGIENDLRRIAKEKDWAVKKNNRMDSGGGSAGGTATKPAPRGSGAPPAPPNGSNDKQSRRAALIDKYPVIAHGVPRG